MWGLAWFLLALGFAGLIVFVVWDYRKKAAARAAARGERFSRIFGAAGEGRALPAPTAAAVAGEAPAAATAAVQAAAPAAPSYAGRKSFLSVQHGKLFALLAAALPGHEIFVHVSLAAVLDPAGLPEGREREQRSRGLAQHTLDCVVCSPGFAIVAIVDLDDGVTAEARFKAESLKAAGLRYLRWNPFELPPHGQVTDLVTGH